MWLALHSGQPRVVPRSLETKADAPNDIAELVCQIEAFRNAAWQGSLPWIAEESCTVWGTSQIQDVVLLRKTVSPYAERGLRRLEAAVGIAGPEALARILKSLKLDSIDKD